MREWPVERNVCSSSPGRKTSVGINSQLHVGQCLETDCGVVYENTLSNDIGLFLAMHNVQKANMLYNFSIFKRNSNTLKSIDYSRYTRFRCSRLHFCMTSPNNLT